MQSASRFCICVYLSICQKRIVENEELLRTGLVVSRGRATAQKRLGPMQGEMIAAADDKFIAAGAEGFFLEAERAGALQFGQAERGLAFLYRLSREDRQEYLALLQVAAAERRGFAAHYELMGEGELAAVRIHSAPVLGEDGQLRGYSVVVTRADHELFEQSAETARFLNALWKPVIAISESGRLVFVNKAAASHLGISEADCGQPIDRLLLSDMRTGSFDALLEQVLQGATWLGELTPRAGGRSALMRGLGVWQMEGERCVFLVGPSLRPYHQPGHASPEECPECAGEQMRTLLLSALSHELDAPVGLLAQTVAVFRRRLGTGDVSTAMQLAADLGLQAERIRGVFRNVKQLTETAEPLLLEPIGLEHNVGEAVAEHLSRYPERTITLRAREKEAVALADPVAFGEVLMNLLGNAEKFSPRDAEIAVEIAQVEEHCVVVRVLDRGPGIPTGESQRVFDAFYRGGATAHTPGLGLGLAVSRQLVERMGGELRPLPRDGGGTIFEIHLQAAPVTAGARRSMSGGRRAC